MIGFGMWLLVKSALPGWVRGIWKWPLGDQAESQVARLMGWSAVLVGAACMPTAYVEVTWERSTAFFLAAIAAMFLAGAGTFAWIWGVFLSHGKTP